MVDYVSFTDARISKVLVNDRLRDSIPSLSVTRLKRGNKVVFRWKKRIKGTSEYPELTLGSYPAMSINDARGKALEYDGLAEQGIHPRIHEEEMKAEQMKSAITLRQVLEDYNNFRLEFNAPSTIKQRTDTISLVFDDYMDKPFNKLSNSMIVNRYQEWRTQRKAPNRKNKNGSPHSAKLAMRYLNSLFNYALSFELVEKNPMARILKPMQVYKKAESKGIYLKVPECKKLYEGLIDFRLFKADGVGGMTTEDFMKVKSYKESWRSWHSLVGYQLMEMLFFTGLRVGDVARLTWDTVHIDGNDEEDIPHFTLKIQKNQNRLFAIPLTFNTKRIFVQLKALQFDSPYVFPDILDTKALPITKKPKVNSKGEVIGKIAPYMISSKKKLKARYKTKSELRINNERGYGSTKRVCENIQNYIFPSGFQYQKTTKMMPQLLRHNFATHARMCHFTNEQIEMITGHSNSYDAGQMGNATLNYVRNLLTVNKPFYEKIEAGLMGDLYDDIVIPIVTADQIKHDDLTSYEDFDVVEGGFTLKK
jgi:site-specific recombinase XerD